MYAESRFYQRPWFFIFAWSLFLGSIYAYQIHRLGGWRLNLPLILLDSFLFLVGLCLWMGFFAQFILPVRTAGDRERIFDRLLLYLCGLHGPAIFVENGRVRKRGGQIKRRGLGVIWLDTASAAVLRTPVAFTRAVGPGIYFTRKDEFIAGTVDLHTQLQVLGPRENERPFEPKTQAQSEAEYAEVQKRRLEVSALTRDGIEVVPDIRVVFKIDEEKPDQADIPGTRFGYNREAVLKAITGQGVNPDQPSDTPRHRMTWNQLPALLAADLWREYLSKFTLSELFEATQTVPPAPTGVPQPAERELTALYEPLQAGAKTGALEALGVGVLHILNAWLKAALSGTDGAEGESARSAVSTASDTPQSEATDRREGQFETALQTINRLVTARLQKQEVGVVDDFGQYTDKKQASSEYRLLQERGLKVVSVTINNLRFKPAVEELVVRQWTASWVKNAKAERDRLDRRRSLIELQSRDSAFKDYAGAIGREILSSQPSGPDATLKTLLSKTRRDLARNDHLHRRLSTEIDELTEIIQWVEQNGQ
jgi:hypothetical protein